eukprot:PhM_4_TR17295/c0_g1_i1/m.74296/K01056/PTH1, pth, spoVC; peptidyl-tRNA hydrolase, PTH1 family
MKRPRDDHHETSSKKKSTDMGTSFGKNNSTTSENNNMLQSPHRRLVVGLGNPGSMFDRTPHNLGFAVIKRIHVFANVEDSIHPTLLGSYNCNELGFGSNLLSTLRPTTMMNLSGQSVSRVLRSSLPHISGSDVLIVHDDTTLDLGRMKLQHGEAHSSHNGLKSLISCKRDGLNPHSDFYYLRIGCGRRNNILDKFRDEEWDVVQKVLNDAAVVTGYWASGQVDKAMTLGNEKTRNKLHLMTQKERMNMFVNAKTTAEELLAGEKEK